MVRILKGFYVELSFLCNGMRRKELSQKYVREQVSIREATFTDLLGNRHEEESRCGDVGHAADVMDELCIYIYICEGE